MHAIAEIDRSHCSSIIPAYLTWAVRLSISRLPSYYYLSDVITIDQVEINFHNVQ